MKFRAAITAGVLTASSVAFGVAGLGTVQATSGLDTVDAHKLGIVGDEVDTEPIGNVRAGDEVAVAAETDNLELLSTVETGRSSDMQFQRREGEQVLRGEVIVDTRDYAFIGTVRGEDGFAVVDVTDPTAPELLSSVSCGAFHNDIVVWEQYVVLGHDGSADSCDGSEDLDSVTGTGEGVWIFDVTDPANPDLVRHYGTGALHPLDKLPRGPHNISMNPEAGLLYFSMQALGDVTPKWGYVSLIGDLADNHPEVLQMRDMGVVTADGCHDQATAHGVATATGERDLLFCAAVGSTVIWDISEDPTAPQFVSEIFNPDINIHHGARLAPDGVTLVINDELAGATAVNCTAGAPVGALFAYDITVPEAPIPLGYGAEEDSPVAGTQTCTSHFYNYIAAEDNDDAAQLSVTGWYVAGLIVHDFSRIEGVGPVAKATTYAQSTPEGASMWAGYAYRGHLYATSYGSGNSGLFIYGLDGYTPEAGEDAPGVNPWDEGVTWGRWTGGTGA